MRRLRGGRALFPWLPLGLGLLAAGALAPAMVAAEPRPAAEQEEAPLPDIEAIERGARPKASVSFDRGRPLQRSSDGQETQGEPGSGAAVGPPEEGENVRRLKVP